MRQENGSLLSSTSLEKVREDSIFCFPFLKKENLSVLYSCPFPLVRDDKNKECDCERRTFVSWIRRKDLHVLTVGRFTYTSDQRFQTIHLENSDDWTLQVKYPQSKDGGVYECQVSTVPKMSHFVNLNVIVCVNPDLNPASAPPHRASSAKPRLQPMSRPKHRCSRTFDHDLSATVTTRYPFADEVLTKN
ncbi:uncharacterized protein TNCV_1862271 [Trichonephila clavipes]|nr:uncharacterized protein TNCV_1862271 [Trichonephila clavipes]